MKNKVVRRDEKKKSTQTPSFFCGYMTSNLSFLIIICDGRIDCLNMSLAKKTVYDPGIVLAVVG